MSATVSARSYLYVPGNRPEWMAKASVSGADAIVLDLEDGVAPSAKDDAVAHVARFLNGPTSNVQLWVRVDGGRLDDFEAIVGPSLTGLFVPGAEPKLLRDVATRLDAVERDVRVPRGSIHVIALVETAAALASLPELAESPRLLGLGIGEADLAAELWMQPDDDRRELWPARFAVVVASATAGLAPPVGPVETVLDDPDRLVRTTRTQLQQGFRGRTAIHPSQIATINAMYTPTAAEVEHARAVVRAMEGAPSGRGAVLGTGGQMIDAAVIRSAREVLGRAATRTAG